MTTATPSPATRSEGAAPEIPAQVVVVTGGARGLGRSIVQAFLREGARVAINYRTSGDAAEQLAAAHPGRAIAVQADVRDRAQVDALMATAREAFGAPVSTVVN
ncbi:MAG: SDR family NAD(P)-dependent oxidoreductase, partial [Brachybacterium sp.]|nr:SDR family NAD(P)-dependent oxidoreductase [Brachybacterium sp.]